jgi:hypothetical protein
VTCIGPAPTSIEAWLDTVNTCLVAYGGVDWVSAALMGLATVAVVGAVILAALAFLLNR